MSVRAAAHANGTPIATLMSPAPSANCRVFTSAAKFCGRAKARWRCSRPIDCGIPSAPSMSHSRGYPTRNRRTATPSPSTMPCRPRRPVKARSAIERVLRDARAVATACMGPVISNGCCCCGSVTPFAAEDAGDLIQDLGLVALVLGIVEHQQLELRQGSAALGRSHIGTARVFATLDEECLAFGTHPPLMIESSRMRSQRALHQAARPDLRRYPLSGKGIVGWFALQFGAPGYVVVLQEPCAALTALQNLGDDLRGLHAKRLGRRHRLHDIPAQVLGQGIDARRAVTVGAREVNKAAIHPRLAEIRPSLGWG